MGLTFDHCDSLTGKNTGELNDFYIADNSGVTYFKHINFLGIRTYKRY